LRFEEEDRGTRLMMAALEEEREVDGLPIEINPPLLIANKKQKEGCGRYKSNINVRSIST
jgi:hypothetical protein